MAINPIVAAAGSLPGLNLSGHRKGINGESKNQSSTDPATTSAPLGSNQHLFSHLLNSTEETIGVNPAAAARKP